MRTRLSPSGPTEAFTRTDSVASATILANTTNDLTFPEAELRTTDQISTTPQGVGTAGMVWSAFCAVAGVLTIRRANVTAASITPVTATFVTRIERSVLP